MKKEKVQWMLATNIVKNSRNFVDTSTSKSYHPAGAHAHDRAMKMLKLDCSLLKLIKPFYGFKVHCQFLAGAWQWVWAGLIPGVLAGD